MRGRKRPIDANGFLTCPGATDAGLKAHREHISNFYQSGQVWWISKDGEQHRRPGSYCRTCYRLKYWASAEVKGADDLVYDSATVMDLQQWANAGDVRASELYRQWRE